jgi:hypothetical protein
MPQMVGIGPEGAYMPEVYLDGSPLDIEDRENDSTVGTLLDAVEKELKGLRRFVSEVWIEGERRDEWRKKDVYGLKLSSVGEIKITSGSVDEMMLKGLDTVEEFMLHIESNIEKTVKKTRSGAGDILTAVSMILGDLNEVVKTIDSLLKGAGPDGASLFRENPANFYKGLLDDMKALKDAYSQGDTILMADILEYELKPYIAGMREKIFPSREA